MDRLATHRAGSCRLDLPANGVANQHVPNDLTGLEFYVTDLER